MCGEYMWESKGDFEMYPTLKICIARTLAYEARTPSNQIDHEKLSSMKSGCIRRRLLDDADLAEEARNVILELVGNEPVNLFEI